MSDFLIAWGELEIHEGGYVNDPVDRGGETFRGIARNFHGDWPGWEKIDRAHREHPADFVERIEADEELYDLAREFFREKFWNAVRGDEISNQHIANKVFDIAVNQGVATGSKFLQESLNLLNRNGNNYPDIAVDGSIGPATLEALDSFMKLEEGRPDYLLKLLNLMQGCRYLEVMRKDKSQERFARGWLNRVDLR